MSLPHVRATTTSPNRLVYYVRKIYHPLGFHKGYNFLLFVLTIGALMGFTLARFEYLNFDGKFLPNTIPGEQYWYQFSLRRAGIILHLAGVVPGGFLACFQFVPIIRYKIILFHRMNGYVCIILLLLGNAGAFIIARHAVGGSVWLQFLIYFLGLATSTALIIAYISIKTLQIDQHRAWMMRAWVWASSIITLRLIMMAANAIINRWFTYYTTISCAQIYFMYAYKWLANLPADHNPTSQLYPQCTTPDPQIFVAVSTQGSGGFQGPENVAAQFHVTFGMATTLAVFIHVAFLELYLHLTPAEAARLRKVSYERQLAAGFRFASTGSVSATRLGDAPPGWNGPVDVKIAYESDSSDPELDRTLTAARLDEEAKIEAVNQSTM